MKLLDIKINGTHHILRTPVVIYAPPTGGKTFFCHKYIGSFSIVDTDNEILSRYGSFNEWFKVNNSDRRREILEACLKSDPDIIVTNLGSAVSEIYMRSPSFTPIGVEVLSNETMKDRLIRRGDDPRHLGSWVEKSLKDFRLPLNDVISCKMRGSEYLTDVIKPIRSIII